jgi:hypothetical protein
MATNTADIDRLLSLINAKDIETLKKEDYDIFQYQGFDPYRLVQALSEMKSAKNISDESFSDDICKMIAIGLIKGNVNEHNLTKMTDAGQKDIKELSERYSIDISKGSGKGKPADVVTFPRVTATFPNIAVRFTKVLGGKEFRGGPFQSYLLPDVMQIQVFPSVIPVELEKNVKEFFLTAALCYSIDQTIQISRMEDVDLQSLVSTQFPYVNLSHNSPLPKTDVRRQTFNQLGLPDKYEEICRVVRIYQDKIDKSMTIISLKEYKQALAIV